MRVVLVDPAQAGHHFPYLAGVARAVAELPGARAVISVTEYSKGREEYRQHIQPLEGVVEVVAEMPRVTYKKLSLIRYTREMFAYLRSRLKPDAILLPSGDPFTQIASGLTWAGLRPVPHGMHMESCVHRCAFAYPRDGVPRAAPDGVSIRALSHGPWDRVHVVDHMALARLMSEGGGLGRRIRERCALVPDPVKTPRVTSMAEARRELRIPTDGRLIGCTGMIDERKGVDLLLGAFLRASADGRLRRDDRLLLAGLASAGVRAMLAGSCAELVRAGRIISIDRFLSEEEMDLSLTAPDVVCTPHPSHVGISSIALRAAACGRPVLGSNHGWQGWFLERFGLGKVCPVRDEAGFAQHLAQALDASASFSSTPASEAILRFHSPANFRACWTVALRKKLGLPPSPDLITWEQTLAEAGLQESRA